VITWAAGNGAESVDNDGYASYAKVIAVAACNDLGRQSRYSDHGAAVWCSFPSSNGSPSRTPGIWTTDRHGREGYNAGDDSLGDAAGDYTNSFGGTSSAAPGVAGVAALILSANPDLRWDEVKDLLRASADRIDDNATEYDQNGHSNRYGYGRVNAAAAVRLAASRRALSVSVARN
jgi:subtilisin family serine protease